eukprot:8688976-Alexandrium_andersonii.AAC.1
MHKQHCSTVARVPLQAVETHRRRHAGQYGARTMDAAPDCRALTRGALHTPAALGPQGDDTRRGQAQPPLRLDTGEAVRPT